MLVVFNTYEQIVDALSLPVSNVSNDQLTQLKSLVAEFPDIFAFSDVELSCTDLIKHSIDTGNHPSIK